MVNSPSILRYCVCMHMCVFARVTCVCVYTCVYVCVYVCLWGMYGYVGAYMCTGTFVNAVRSFINISVRKTLLGYICESCKQDNLPDLYKS